MRSYHEQMLEKAAFRILLVSSLDLSQSRSKTISLPGRDIVGLRALGAGEQ